MDRLHPPAELDEDAVNELLASLRIRSTVYCHSDMRAPWGFAVKAKDVCAFHLVVDGACWLEVDGTDGPVRLESGDVVLLMTGRSHRLKDDSSSDVEWLDEILTRTPAHRGHLHYGGSGPRTELLCGGFLVEGSQASALLLAIPPVLRIHRNDPADADWLSGLLASLRAEVADPRPGAAAILAVLADLLVTHVIRSYLLDLGERRPAGHRGTPGPPHRQGHPARSCRPGPCLDRGGTGRRGRHVPLRLCRILPSTDGRVAYALRHAMPASPGRFLSRR